MKDDDLGNGSQIEIITLTTNIVSSYVGANSIQKEEIPNLIESVYSRLLTLKSEGSTLADPLVPAVSIEKSIHEDYIICLEDGKKLVMLKRYLKTHFNMTPDQYRQKWGLPYDYPMVCRSYALRRSNVAKKHGLGKRK